MSRPAPEPEARRPLMVLGLLAFLSFGAVQATYGPAFAALQARYGVGVGEVGAIVSAHFFGAFIGVVASGMAVARFGYRPLLVGASLVTAAGAFAVGLAPTWAAAIGGAAGIGLGYGLAVALYNFLFARAFGGRSIAAVNVINGSFGVGAILAPALVGAVTAALAAQAPDEAGRLTTLVFGASALLALVVTVLAARVPWLPAPLAPVVRSGAAARFPYGASALFALVFFVYVASEVSVTAWAPTHLAGHVGPARAALSVSVFWIAMTVGRFAVVAVATRWRPRDLVAGCSLVALAAMALAHVSDLALVAYALAGLAMGPIFPTSVAWIGRRFGDRAEQVGPVALAAGNVGPVLGAPAIGIAAAAAGADAIPTLLTLVLAVLVAVVAATWWTSRRHEGAPA